MALDFRKFTEGLRILPRNSLIISPNTEKGDLQVLDDADGKLYYNNGTSSSPITTESHAATLINKTIDGDDNTVQDLALISLKTVLGDANKTIRRDASGVVISGNALPNSSQIVTLDSSDILTNKTLTSPILNTPSTDTVTGISGGALTIQSASNQNLSLQAQGSGSAVIENITVKDNTITGSNSSTLFVKSGNSQNLSLSTSAAGTVTVGDTSLSSTLINLDSDAYVNRKLSLTASANSQTGSNVTISTTTTPYIKLTGVGLNSVAGITASANDGQSVILTNLTGSAVLLLNESASASASDRIVTGTGGNISFASNGSAFLIYNTTSSRWQVISVVQSSSIPTPSITTITTNTTLSSSNDTVLVNGSAITVTLPNPSTLSPGKTFDIKKIYNDNLTITINTLAGTIDDSSTKTIISRYDSLRITTDGSNYFLI